MCWRACPVFRDRMRSLGTVGLVLLSCLAAGISYAGMAQLCATTESADAGSIEQPVPAWPLAAWARMAGDAAGQFCHWIVPSLWLFLATGLGSYIISGIWPQVPSGSLWIVIPLAVVLACGLSYVPSRGVGDVCLSTICVIQVGLVIVFPIIVATNAWTAYRTRNQPKYDAFFLDATTGNTTPYMQDSTPAGKPKVDPDGNPVWVYDVVDDNGDLLLDATGHPIIVPTDDNGKLGPCHPARRRPFRRRSSLTMLSRLRPLATLWKSGPFQDVKPAAAPFAPRYLLATTCGAILSVAGYQFLAALGNGRRYKRPFHRGLTLLLLVLVQCGGFYLIQWWARSHLLHSGYYSVLASTGNAQPRPWSIRWRSWDVGIRFVSGRMVVHAVADFDIAAGSHCRCLDRSRFQTGPGLAMARESVVATGTGPRSRSLPRRSHSYILLHHAGLTVLLCTRCFSRSMATQ